MTAALYTQHMVVRTRFRGAAATVVISGELDFCTEHALALALRDVLDQRPERLTLDLTDLTFIDCAAVRILASAGRALPGGRKAVIRRPNRAVRRMLELTGAAVGFWIDYSLPGRQVVRTHRRYARPRTGFGLS